MGYEPIKITKDLVGIGIVEVRAHSQEDVVGHHVISLELLYLRDKRIWVLTAR